MTWWRNLLRHPVRSGLAIAGITVTTAMLLDMVLLAGGIERSFERLLLGRGYQIRVSPSGTLPFDTEATIPGAAGLRAAFRSDPGVAAVAPLLGASVYARAGDSLVPLFAYGTDPAEQAIYQPVRGADLVPGDSLGVLLSAPAATRLGLGPGDTVTVVGRLDPQLAAAGGARSGETALRFSRPALACCSAARGAVAGRGTAGRPGLGLRAAGPVR
jgi:putative ABC transport system permease protein